MKMTCNLSTKYFLIDLSPPEKISNYKTCTVELKIKTEITYLNVKVFVS